MNAKELNELLETAEITTIPGEYEFREPIKRIELSDGNSLSVQASETHYCAPRENHGPWDLVEVGFPSVEPPETWAEYFDGDWDNDDRTGSVYGYVPIDLVVDFINEHGGMANANNSIQNN